MSIVERLAERYGFEWRDPAWNGRIDGLPLELIGFDDQVQVTVQLPNDQPEDLALAMDSERPVPPWPFPAEALVITGDARFDAEAHVVGDAVHAFARLDRSAREALRGWPGLTLNHRQARVCISTRRLADQFMGTLRALRHTLEQLVIPDGDCLPRLVARLQDGREPVSHQQAVLQTLAQSGWLETGLVRTLFDHPRPEIRMEAATLAPQDDPEAARTLWAMLDNKAVEPKWRAEALHRWMARTPEDLRRGGLTQLMNAPYPEVVAATCFWWGQQPDAREKLAGWLKHRSTEVRAAAMIALGGLATVLKPHEEATIIRALHHHRDTAVVQAALQALQVGGIRSLRAVRDYLESSRPTPEARQAARVTLKALQTRRRSLPGRLAIVDNPGEGQLSLPGTGAPIAPGGQAA